MRVSAAVAAVAALALTHAPAPAEDGGEAIAIHAEPVPLIIGEPQALRVGGLRYRGGLALSSDDPRFGGLSGLAVFARGTGFVAVTDAGDWIAGSLSWDEGRPVAVENARMMPLRDSAGTPLTGKELGDAEEVAATPGGGWLVAFERRHRLLAYAAPGSRGVRAFPAFDTVGLAPNRGIEAMTFLADGTLFALSEGRAADAPHAAWLVDNDRVVPFAYPMGEFFLPTAAAPLPDGGVLVLERGYSRLAGVKARLVRIDSPRAGMPAAPREIARLEPPMTVDNFEALAVWRAPGGGTALLVASDDNFSPRQRTLLLAFTLAD